MGVSFCGTRMPNTLSPTIDNTGGVLGKMPLKVSSKRDTKTSEGFSRSFNALRKMPSLTDCLDEKCDLEAKDGVLLVTAVSAAKKNVSIFV